VKAPSDFTIARSETSPEPVDFSHDKHQTKVDKCTLPMRSYAWLVKRLRSS
jgi:hypothetical protein